MALYKSIDYLAKSNDALFDADHLPGTAPPYTGIYRCMGCGREIVAEGNRKLPPESHHLHDNTTQGTVRWRLIVYADHRPKKQTVTES